MAITKYLQLPLPFCIVDAHTYLRKKNVASTLRRLDARIHRAHARPFGYISRAALIPVHIQSHPLARSRKKKKKNDEGTRLNRSRHPSSRRARAYYFVSLSPLVCGKHITKSSKRSRRRTGRCQYTSASSKRIATGFS